ncbi:hypothetical protein CYMTET_13318 [Cymbomonas tetramitiformis]|uniref:Uncharacterized protein n=1 Tax=Cymbomonas tetramitiformis TaxID=36881 RepID=A0AAE0GIR1_9CHLO|nr:hypothetical protein CYMTET_13318 [Cymbomonas tetramitiformis]
MKTPCSGGASLPWIRFKAGFHKARLICILAWIGFPGLLYQVQAPDATRNPLAQISSALPSILEPTHEGQNEKGLSAGHLGLSDTDTLRYGGSLWKPAPAPLQSDPQFVSDTSLDVGAEFPSFYQLDQPQFYWESAVEFYEFYSFVPLQADLGIALPTKSVCVVGISPTVGLENGGTTVTLQVAGEILPHQAPALSCQFGTQTVRAVSVLRTSSGDSVIKCIAPPRYPTNLRTVAVRLSLDGVLFTHDGAPFHYHAPFQIAGDPIAKYESSHGWEGFRLVLPLSALDEQKYIFSPYLYGILGEPNMVAACAYGEKWFQGEFFSKEEQVVCFIPLEDIKHQEVLRVSLDGQESSEDGVWLRFVATEMALVPFKHNKNMQPVSNPTSQISLNEYLAFSPELCISIDRGYTTSLASLKISVGDLYPDFDPDVHDYSVVLQSKDLGEDFSLGVTPVTPLSALGYVVKVSNQSVGKGQTARRALRIGENQISVEITSELGVPNNYNLNVYVLANAPTSGSLSLLHSSIGELDPEFDPENDGPYSVLASTTQLQISLQAASFLSKPVKICQRRNSDEHNEFCETFASGDWSSPVGLKEGLNVLQLNVLAENCVPEPERQPLLAPSIMDLVSKVAPYFPPGRSLQPMPPPFHAPPPPSPPSSFTNIINATIQPVAPRTPSPTAAIAPPSTLHKEWALEVWAMPPAERRAPTVALVAGSAPQPPRIPPPLPMDPRLPAASADVFEHYVHRWYPDPPKTPTHPHHRMRLEVHGEAAADAAGTGSLQSGMGPGISESALALLASIGQGDSKLSEAALALLASVKEGSAELSEAALALLAGIEQDGGGLSEDALALLATIGRGGSKTGQSKMDHHESERTHLAGVHEMSVLPELLPRVSAPSAEPELPDAGDAILAGEDGLSQGWWDSWDRWDGAATDPDVAQSMFENRSEDGMLHGRFYRQEEHQFYQPLFYFPMYTPFYEFVTDFYSHDSAADADVARGSRTVCIVGSMPQLGPDEGGTRVILKLAGQVSSHQARRASCQFASQRVPADRVSTSAVGDTTVECVAPALMEGEPRTVSVRLSLDDAVYTHAGPAFHYHAPFHLGLDSHARFLKEHSWQGFKLTLPLIPSNGSSALFSPFLYTVHADALFPALCVYGDRWIPGELALVEEQVTCTIPVEELEERQLLRVSLDGVTTSDDGLWLEYSPSSHTLEVVRHSWGLTPAVPPRDPILGVEYLPFSPDHCITTDFAETALLDSLELSAGRLEPPFEPETFEYTVMLERSDVTDFLLALTPTTSDWSATILVAGVAVPQGQPVSSRLRLGENRVAVKVASKNKHLAHTYVVRIFLLSGPSDEGGLTVLIPSTGELDPLFDMGETGPYTLIVESDISDVFFRIASMDGSDVSLCLRGGSRALDACQQVETDSWSAAVELRQGINLLEARSGELGRAYEVLVFKKRPIANALADGRTVATRRLIIQPPLPRRVPPPHDSPLLASALASPRPPSGTSHARNLLALASARWTPPKQSHGSLPGSLHHNHTAAPAFQSGRSLLGFSPQHPHPRNPHPRPGPPHPQGSHARWKSHFASMPSAALSTFLSTAISSGLPSTLPTAYPSLLLSMPTRPSGYTGPGSMGTLHRTPISVLLTAEHSVITPPGDLAAQEPFGLPTSSALTLTVRFSDGTCSDFSQDNRVVMTVVRGATEVFLESATAVAAPSGAGLATVAVAFRHYTLAEHLHGVVNITVVRLASVALAAHPFPSFGGSAAHNLTRLQRVHCSDGFQRATLHLHAQLTDGVTHDVTNQSVFLSGKPEVVMVQRHNILAPVREGASLITGYYGGDNYSDYIMMHVDSSNAARITSIQPWTSWGANRTFLAEPGSQQALRARVQLDDGTEFPDAIGGVSWIPLQDMLLLNSSEGGSVLAEGNGNATLLQNHHAAVTLRYSAAVCERHRLLETASATETVFANLGPALGDMDIGAKAGIALPPAASGERLHVDLRVNAGSGSLRRFGIELHIDPEHLVSEECIPGTDWAYYHFNCVVNHPPEVIHVEGADATGSAPASDQLHIATVVLAVGNASALSRISGVILAMNSSEFNSNGRIYEMQAGHMGIQLNERMHETQALQPQLPREGPPDLAEALLPHPPPFLSSLIPALPKAIPSRHPPLPPHQLPLEARRSALPGYLRFLPLPPPRASAALPTFLPPVASTTQPTSYPSFLPPALPMSASHMSFLQRVPTPPAFKPPPHNAFATLPLLAPPSSLHHTCQRWVPLPPAPSLPSCNRVRALSFHSPPPKLPVSRLSAYIDQLGHASLGSRSAHRALSAPMPPFAPRGANILTPEASPASAFNLPKPYSSLGNLSMNVTSVPEQTQRPLPIFALPMVPERRLEWLPEPPVPVPQLQRWIRYVRFRREMQQRTAPAGDVVNASEPDGSSVWLEHVLGRACRPRTPAAVSIFSQYSRIAVLDDAAASDTIGLPSFSQLSVVVHFDDSSCSNFTGDSRVVYSVDEGGDHARITVGSVMAVAPGAVRVRVHLRGYPEAAHLSDAVTLTVVQMETVGLWAQPYPAYLFSAVANVSVLKLVHCTSQWQRATVHAMALLTDGSAVDVTHGTNFSAVDAELLRIELPNVLAPLDSGYAVVLGQFWNRSASLTVTVEASQVQAVHVEQHTRWQEGGTLAGEWGTQQRLAVRVVFDDGTEFPDVVGGVPWMAAGELLRFESSAEEAVRVDAQGVALLLGNHHRAVEITAVAVACFDGEAAEAAAARATDRVYANLEPSIGDVDLGQRRGLQFPASSEGEVLQVEVRVNFGSWDLLAAAIVVHVDAEAISMQGCRQGTDWEGEWSCSFSGDSLDIHIEGTAPPRLHAHPRTNSFAILDLVVGNVSALSLINGTVLTMVRSGDQEEVEAYAILAGAGWVELNGGLSASSALPTVMAQDVDDCDVESGGCLMRGIDISDGISSGAAMRVWELSHPSPIEEIQFPSSGLPMMMDGNVQLDAGALTANGTDPVPGESRQMVPPWKRYKLRPGRTWPSSKTKPPRPRTQRPVPPSTCACTCDPWSYWPKPPARHQTKMPPVAVGSQQGLMQEEEAGPLPALFPTAPRELLEGFSFWTRPEDVLPPPTVTRFIKGALFDMIGLLHRHRPPMSPAFPPPLTARFGIFKHCRGIPPLPPGWMRWPVPPSFTSVMLNLPVVPPRLHACCAGVTPGVSTTTPADPFTNPTTVAIFAAAANTVATPSAPTIAATHIIAATSITAATPITAPTVVSFTISAATSITCEYTFATCEYAFPTCEYTVTTCEYPFVTCK